MRLKTAQLTKKKDKIEWRSHEPQRLETYSDAVFAFAVTLIIVSLEVPKSFDELLETMKGTLSFAVCFAILFQIWNNQNLFFRRYGLNDAWTVALNGMLLFMVLIYAYPLKFLFGMVFGGHTYMLNGHLHEVIKDVQTPTLMLIYGAGFTIIWLLFSLMYANAKRQSKELGLDEREIFETQTIVYLNLICASIGGLAILLAWLLPDEYSGLSGFVYCLIGVAYTVWLSYRGGLARKRFKSSE
ncbi:MAG: TMEM175 family protein [Bacteroidota bacterium]|nr:TMEM175 family protein [Bacteroidota bacterium]